MQHWTSSVVYNIMTLDIQLCFHYQKTKAERMDIWKFYLSCHIWVSISITSHPRSKLYWSASQWKWFSCVLQGRINCIKNLKGEEWTS